jgi:hypothetical protein
MNSILIHHVVGLFALSAGALFAIATLNFKRSSSKPSLSRQPVLRSELVLFPQMAVNAAVASDEQPFRQLRASFKPSEQCAMKRDSFFIQAREI